MAQGVKQFLKAQLSAFVGGMVDYAIMICGVELFELPISTSIVISGAIGAVVNFSINRYWTFKDEQTKVGDQLWKFIIVVIGSILLKSQGTPLLTDITGIDYRITRLMVELVVSLGFNFTLQKFWVFRKGASKE
ncbi:GtrA family protein [Sphingobacterium sp. lm-10]|uniref:GtrA family protein n=1 Tax=Sphingobacterium sp. lm-10 TaxID=2944904 RepID=UPI002020E230|nr:GtrA family protein [Sphingobacterium sp. lm-10]MCL7989189.1 GtrA family protein [Sphingobacterium sp. lm-10]MCL8000633.1 GtrA family protein [Brucella sp. 21LCYQ03]